MDFKKWIWCLHCQRSFEVSLSREPREGHGQLESLFSFTSDLVKQLGRELNGQVSVRCGYKDCYGTQIEFWWWEDYLARHSEAPKTPLVDTVYRLYAKAGA